MKISGIKPFVRVVFIITLILSAFFRASAQVPTLYTPLPSTEQLYIYWDAFPAAVSYKLYWSNTPGQGTSGNEILITGVGQISYRHTGLTGGIPYYYVVVAVDNLGFTTLPSNEVTAIPVPQYYYHYGGDGDGYCMDKTCFIKLDNTPATPNSQDITVYASVERNYIYWPQEASAIDYLLEYSLDAGGPWTPLTTTTSLSYLHTGLTGGTTYYYRVTANLPSCVLNPSQVVNATAMPQYYYHYGGNGDGHCMEKTCIIKLDGTDAPPFSQDITVYASVERNYIFWPQEASAVDYTLEYGLSSTGPWTPLTTTTSLSYLHTGLTGGTTYYYRVTANVVGCPLQPSPVVDATAIPQYYYYEGGDGDGHCMEKTCIIKLDGSSAAPLSQPITVYASVERNYIFWPQEASAVNYTLEYGLAPTGPWTPITTTTSLNYLHNGLTGGTTYYYRVTANVVGCPLQPSPVVTATALPQYYYAYGGDGDGHCTDKTCIIKLDGISAAPLSQAITVYASVERNYIYWPQEASAVNYTLEYGMAPTGPWTPLTTTTSLNYLHSGLTGGTAYYYRVTANVVGCPLQPSPVVGTITLPQYYFAAGGNGDGHCMISTCVIKLDGSNAAPLSQNITVYAGTEHNYIYWPQEAGATNYSLEYGMSSTGPWTPVTTTTNLYYNHTGLTGGLEYFYRVTANVASCPFNPSAVVSGLVIPQYYYFAGGNGDGHAHCQSCTFITLDATTIYVSDSTDLCEGDTVVLTASYSNWYTWNTGETDQIIYVTESGSYSVVLFNIYSCTSISLNVNLNFDDAPPNPSVISANPTGTSCGPVLLTVGGAPVPDLYYWQGTNPSGTSTSLPASNPYLALISGTYYVRALDTNGCWSLGSSNSSPDITAIPTQITPTPSTSMCNISGQNAWNYMIAPDGKAIASLQDSGQTLGQITSEVFITGSLSNKFDGTNEFLGRHFVINTQNPPGSTVVVRLYFSVDEFNDLVTASAATPSTNDDVTVVSGLSVSKYDGPTEDGVYDFSDAIATAIIPNIASGSSLGGYYIDIPVDDFSEFWIHGGNMTPLPVEVVNFDANCNEEQKALISWITASENNNNSFYIERSFDLMEWKNIAIISGSGNSNEPVYYSYVDDKFIEGTTYYRLRQNDFDGNFMYFDPVALNCEKNEKPVIEVYPNPFSDYILFESTGFFKENVDITITDVVGHIVKEVNLTPNEFVPVYSLDMPNIAKGIYYVNINSQEFNGMYKIIKQ